MTRVRNLQGQEFQFPTPFPLEAPLIHSILPSFIQHLAEKSEPGIREIERFNTRDLHLSSPPNSRSGSPGEPKNLRAHARRPLCASLLDYEAPTPLPGQEIKRSLTLLLSPAIRQSRCKCLDFDPLRHPQSQGLGNIHFDSRPHGRGQDDLSDVMALGP